VNPSLNEVLSKATAAVRARNPDLVSLLALRESSAAKPQHPARLGIPKAVQAQVRRAGKCLVRVTSYRRRLLDTDNLVAKWHIDALRYAGVLHSDAPEQAHIETRQVKVGSADEERTEILIEDTPD
jgi:hypothetical protein